MTATLSLGYSPCPNDTFIFYALVHGKVRVPGIEFREELHDVETLNTMAMNSELDITKISFHALGRLREHYALLRSGSALGRGCGPLIVARPGTRLDDLKNGAVAIPGLLTTAYLLLRLYNPSIANIQVITFDRIMDAVTRKEVIAGLIIHESRFTYPRYHLEKLLDLGEWWEHYSGLPIPLGGILGRRTLGPELLLRVESGIRESLAYARLHVSEVLQYCRQHSQEMNEEVMKSHIDLYVNDFSLDLGDEGLRAVARLISEAELRQVFPRSVQPLLAGA
ncbi:MAG TPA: 1,4-dihydroxy-6-naphthoate synthase [Nitrospirota bacterium]|nr:1,4-dihydroxy-6-naphthoate synthase [Nitrospirota bacterium]